MRPRVLRAAMAAFVSVTAFAVVPPSSAVADDWVAPGFVRSIGGRGEAGVYAWGNEYNPVTNEILVGDYWNFQVRRFDATTGKELGAFYRPPNVRKGQPYTVSVDPRNGDIYVPEWGDGQSFSGSVGRYSKTGEYLGELKISAAYNVWSHIDSQGWLWIADSHFWNYPGFFPAKLRGWDLSNLQDTMGYFGQPGADGYYDANVTIGDMGSGPGQLSSDVHGVTTDSAGYVYAADAINRRVHKYTRTGAWVMDMGFGAGTAVPGPKGGFTGDLRGIAIDEGRNRLYVVDAEAGQIEVFDPQTGAAVGQFGSLGDGPGQFADGAREITVDGSGNVWASDFGHFRILKFSPTGTLLGIYPDPPQSPASGNFAQVRDVAVTDAGDVWAVDTWNQRFSRFSADGSLEAEFGQRGSHAPYGTNYPRGIAIDPATGNVWVSNTRDHQIRVYDAGGTFLRTLGSGANSDSPGSFKWVMDIEFFDGKAYVSDYQSAFLKVLDAVSGDELLRIVESSNRGVAVDPATGNIYAVRFGSSDRVDVFGPTGAPVTLPSGLTSFGSSGTGQGQFMDPWDIDIIGGRVYVTDPPTGRVSVFELDGTFVGSWGSAGTGVDKFSNLSGITHDADGTIYLADTGNDRIVEYSYAVPQPSGDTTAPGVTLTLRTNTVVPAASVTFTGVAADDVGVSRIETAVQDRVSKRWWNAKNAVWQPSKTWNMAAMAGPSNASVTWTSVFVGGARGGQYLAQVRSFDTSSLVSVVKQATFSMAS